MKPIIKKSTIIDFLRSKNLEVEIFDEVPTDYTNVRHGLYVGHPMIANIETVTNGMQRCGTFAWANDTFEIHFVSQQDDDKLESVSDVLTDIPYSTMLQDYTDVTFTVERQYQNRAEYRIYTYALKRLDLD